MNNRLFIDNVLVDLSEDVNITLVINSNLFRDISKITGNTTYTVRLPRTAHNAAVFGMAGDVRSSGNFSTLYHRADYYRDGVPIIRNGSAILLSVSDMYEISISWGAFAPLADIINNGLTLNQLTGNETIQFAQNNRVTTYAQAMSDGYYYALYDPRVPVTASGWICRDVAAWNQGTETYTFQAGVVLTGGIGDTIVLSPASRAGTQYVIAPFTFGMMLNVSNVTGAADAAAWCVVDATSTIILKCEDLTPNITESILAPVNSAYVVINTTSGGNAGSTYYGKSKNETPYYLYDGFMRLPVVNVSWILERIKTTTGVEFAFPQTVKDYIDTLAIPLVSAKANSLTTGGLVQMAFATQYQLGTLAVLAAANTIFAEQSGAVYQLTATRSAKVNLDIQAFYLWNFANATPSGDGRILYNGISETVKNYEFYPVYIEIKIQHTDPNTDDNIYTVGVYEEEVKIRVSQFEDESMGGNEFTRLIAATGEIDVVAGDVFTCTLKNYRGELDALAFANGRILINENTSGDVPRGALFPIVHNLPEIKVIDLVKFLCAITATVPLNRQEAGKVYFEKIANLFSSASYDWTTKVIPAHTNFEQAQEVTYRLNEYAKKNWYKWKNDDKVFGNYDASLYINDDTLEAEHTILEFPFAASDGNRVPIFEDKTSIDNTEDISLEGCEPRIMNVYETDSGFAALRFDIDMQNVVDNQMVGMSATLADVRVIKERIRMSDVELAAFNESKPVYLRQYGSYFAVLSLESNGDGTAVATMLRLRASVALPPYDYEVDYLESDGLAFINTGIKASNSVQIKTYIADFFDEQNKNKGAFGGRSGGGSSEFGMMLNNSGNVIVGNGANPITLSPYTNYSPRCHVEFGGGAWKIGAATGTYTEDTYVSNYNVYLFAMNNSGGAVKGKLKIGATQITDGVTTLDLIPVVKNGVGYMYDRISGQLFGNSGSGAFTWGNLPYDADVEYLESTATSGFYIDSGIGRPSTFNSAEIQTKVQFTSTSGRQIAGATNEFYFGRNANRWECRYQSYYGTADTNKHDFAKRIEHTTKTYEYVYLDGTLIYTYNKSFANADFQVHIGLFNYDIGSSVGWQAKLYIEKIYVNDVLERDFIPVRKNGVGYMYDRVTDTLFGNDGTGDFVFGNDV